MPAPIALQLYTVRNIMKQDFAGVMTRIAEIGYLGVEPGLTYITDVPGTVELYHRLGLQVPSVLTHLPIDDEKRTHLDEVASLGCRYVGISWLPPAEFQSIDSIKASAERLNAADTIVRQHGLTLFYHNHWFEFEPIFDGVTPHQILRENLNPTIQFEIDVYWLKTGGSDPIEVVRQLGARAPLLHIKDGPAIQKEPMTAVGEGILDIPAIIKAGEGATQWLIVELDECATDMMEAVEKSYHYLVKKGLARGRKG